MGVVGKIWDVVSCQRRRVPPDAEKSNCVNTSKPSQPEGQSKAEAQSAAKAMKEKGNELFKQNEFEEALYTYTKAAEIYMYDASIWLNRSICNRKLENWEDAATDAEIAQEIEPRNVKAYYNRAVALQLGSKPSEALEICKKGLQVQSDNKALQQLKGDLQRSIAEGQASCPGEISMAPATTSPSTELVQEAKPEVKEPKFSKDGEYQWQNGKPSHREREEYTKAMTDMFRSKYEELKQRAEEAKSKKSALQTDQYEDNQKQGLVLSGGHRPMDRPENVDLPSQYHKVVGLLSPTELEEYGCDNKDRRYLLSVYGNIFDVSDRPDKYDHNGPYASLTGKDLTWGLFAGVDTVEYTNKFYDLFKARDLGKDHIYIWILAICKILQEPTLHLVLGGQAGWCLQLACKAMSRCQGGKSCFVPRPGTKQNMESQWASWSRGSVKPNCQPHHWRRLKRCAWSCKPRPLAALAHASGLFIGHCAHFSRCPEGRT